MAHTAVAIAASPSTGSKSRRLAEYALARAEAAGFTPSFVDLNELPAGGLLGRERSRDVDDAIARVTSAALLIIATPVYRASYSGLLKVFFDQFVPDALAGTVAVPIATGGSPAHQLVVEHALRPLLASLGALVVRSGVYAVDAQFGSEGPALAVREQIDRAVADGAALVGRR